jgi:hypothetical protein
MPGKNKKRKAFRQLKLQLHHGFLQDYLPAFNGSEGLAELKVYHAVAMYADWDSGVSYPSKATIMRTTGIRSTRTVVKAIQRLATKGVLSFEVRKPLDKNGSQYGRKRYFYTLKYPTRAEYLNET